MKCFINDLQNLNIHMLSFHLLQKFIRYAFEINGLIKQFINTYKKQ